MARRKSKKESRPDTPPSSNPDDPAEEPLPPLTIATTNRFERDLIQMRKRGLDLDKIKQVLETLRSREALSARNRDHGLAGNWAGWRECHVAPDWLLIYRTAESSLILGRTGTHSDLFG